jgi:two-component system LytT family response regulator
MSNQNTTIQYVIVDDEQSCINDLRWEIEGLPFQMQEVAHFSASAEALDALPNLKFDLLFLDVQMPHLDGLGLLKSLPKIPFDVIFTTAFNQYAIEAFRVNALDYLLKPVSGQELNRVIQKFTDRRDGIAQAAQAQAIQQVIGKAQGKLAIYTQEGYLYVPFDEIIHLEADSNYSTIYTKAKKHTVSKTLKDLRQKLPEQLFIQVHRSHLVHINHVKSMSFEEGAQLELSNGSKVPVSRERRVFVRSLLS